MICLGTIRTRVCLFVGPWSSSLGCYSRKSSCHSASPFPAPTCRVPIRICPPGAGKDEVTFLLQSPADSRPAKGRWPMG